MSAVTVHELTVPFAGRWISMNDRPHWAERARRTKAWRNTAHWAARSAGLPRGAAHVHVTATVHKATGRRFDAHNLTPTVKAIVDGLVDYGLVPDDSNGFLVGPDMRAGEARDRPCVVLSLVVTGGA